MTITAGPGVYGGGFTASASTTITVPETLVAGDLIALFCVGYGVGEDGSPPTVTDDVGGSNAQSDAVENVQVNGLGVHLILWEIVTGWAPSNQITVTYSGVVDGIVGAVAVHGAAAASVNKTGNDVNPDNVTLGGSARFGLYALAASGATTSYPFNDGGVTDLGDDFNDTPSGISLALGTQPLTGGATVDVAGTPDTATQTMQAFMALALGASPPAVSPVFGHVISLT